MYLIGVDPSGHCSRTSLQHWTFISSVQFGRRAWILFLSGGDSRWWITGVLFGICRFNASDLSASNGEFAMSLVTDRINGRSLKRLFVAVVVLSTRSLDKHSVGWHSLVSSNFVGWIRKKQELTKDRTRSNTLFSGTRVDFGKRGSQNIAVSNLKSVGASTRALCPLTPLCDNAD